MDSVIRSELSEREENQEEVGVSAPRTWDHPNHTSSTKQTTTPLYSGFVHLNSITPDDFRGATDGLLPYSAFNYVSVRSFWPDAQISTLPHGIALVLSDPLTCERYLTALTDGTRCGHLKDLIQYGVDTGMRLRLVPEQTLTNATSALQLRPRPDEFDYIIDIDALLRGQSDSLTRNHQRAQAFLKRHPDVSATEVFLDGEAALQLFAIDDAWRKKHGSNATARWEGEALRRCLATLDSYDLITVAAVDLDGRLMGWTINEIVNDFYNMAHFGKSLPGYPGLSEFLEIETGRLMRSKGCRLMNFQEDLGNPGLRRYKKSWDPIHRLQVFDIDSV